ncbi:MAG TPA: transketolase C-terminal domain-containing protein [Armatimonadota bacterium]|jgi:transketolase|nr:transketolase C-terminal domain-containing protein [Armatimonadota bacterium]
MAKPFHKVLLELAREDPRICGVSCDTSGSLQALHSEFPERVVEVGIAEQNLIGVAAGLADRGKLPFALGMNPFVTMRCFEQIRTDLGYGFRNVKVIGVAAGGVALGGWGCTHHAMEEIGLMRLIPTMTVVMPADAYETEQAVRVAAATDGPFYISLAGGQLPIDVPETDRDFELGKAAVLREGADVTIIGTGPTVADAVKAGEMLEQSGVSARVLSMHTVKPIDRDAVLQAAQTRLIVTIEEHTVIGGLGGAVAEVLADAGAGTPLKRLGLQDTFACMVGDYGDVKARFGITAEAVVDAARGALG